MASLGEYFDPNSVDDRRDLEPIPPGVYLSYIIDSDFKDNSKQNGKIIPLTFEVIHECKHKGHKFFQNINYTHTNEKAQLIGRQELRELALACGKGNALADTSELHFIPIYVTLAIEPGGVSEGGKAYKAKNVPTKYEAASASAKPQAPQYQAPSAPPAPPAPSAPPARQVAPQPTPTGGKAPPPWRRGKDAA